MLTFIKVSLSSSTTACPQTILKPTPNLCLPLFTPDTHKVSQFGLGDIQYSTTRVICLSEDPSCQIYKVQDTGDLTREHYLTFPLTGSMRSTENDCKFSVAAAETGTN